MISPVRTPKGVADRELPGAPSFGVQTQDWLDIPHQFPRFQPAGRALILFGTSIVSNQNTKLFLILTPQDFQPDDFLCNSRFLCKARVFKFPALRPNLLLLKRATRKRVWSKAAEGRI